MKVLLSTGLTNVEKEVMTALKARGDECERCYHRQAVMSCAEKHKADVVVLGPALDGRDDLFDTVVRPLWESGIRIVFLPGAVDMNDTKEWVKKLFPLGVYCFVYDPVTAKGIIDKLDNHGVPSSVASDIRTATVETNSMMSQIDRAFDEVKESDQKQRKKSLLGRFIKTSAKPKEDSLTGCFERDMLQSMNNRTDYAVLFIGLDSQAAINESYGVDAGDMVLKSVGQQLRRACRPQDSVIRYGDDEFLLIYDNIDKDAAIGAADSLSNMPSVIYGGREIVISMCVGIAAYGVHGFTMLDVVKSAEDAMLSAKNMGGYRVVYANVNQASRINGSVMELGNGLIVTNDTGQIERITKDAKQYVVIIDTDLSTTRISSMYGVEGSEVWKHDWRLGLSAKPFKVNRKTMLYTTSEKGVEVTERDIRAMSDIIDSAFSEKKSIIVFYSNIEVIEALKKHFKEAM